MEKTFVWFSFRQDGDLLAESVASVKRACPSAKLYVFDDGLCPVSKKIYDFLLSNNVMYEQTFYPRSGNLIGPENIYGQIKCMAKASKDADWLIKIDCDTILVSDKWIDNAVLEDSSITMIGSYKSNYNYPMGNCYAIRCDKLPELLNDIETYPAWKDCYEDYEVGTRMHRLAHGDFSYAYRYRSGVEDGFWLCNPNDINDLALNSNVVSCGFGFGAVPVNNRKQYKEAQLRIMKNLNAGLLKLDQNKKS